MTGRKLWIMVLALAMLLCACALAQAEAQAIELSVEDGIVAIESGASIDLDGDGAPETVTYELVGEDYDMGSFTVNVGDASIEVSTYCGLEELYVGRLRGDGNVFLLVGERGPSDDPYSYVLHYSSKGITQIGGIPALPEDIAIGQGVLTATVRANAIHTWQRPADYVVARLERYDEDYNPLPIEYFVAESPRESYVMDVAVVLKRDVTLTTATGEELELSAGERAIMTATDDASYVYIVPADLAAHDYVPGGYLGLSDNIFVILDGEQVMTGEVFDGLLFAD